MRNIHHIMIKNANMHMIKYYIFMIFAFSNYMYMIFYKLFLKNSNKNIPDNISDNFIVYLQNIATILTLGIIVWIIVLKFYIYKYKQKVEFFQAILSRSPFFAFYWYFTLWFTLCFLSNYLMLINFKYDGWLLNVIASYMMLIMMVNWMSFLFLSFLGLGCSFFVYKMFASNQLIYDVYYNATEFHNYWASWFYAFITLTGLGFWQLHQNKQTKSIKNKQVFNSAIAHEALSPLIAIQSNAFLLQEVANIIKLNTYVNINIVKNTDKNTDKDIDKNKFIDIKMDKDTYDTLVNFIPKNMKNMIIEAKEIINIILTLMKNVDNLKQNTSYMSKIIDEVIDNYDTTLLNKANIQIIISEDFVFYGSKYIIKHVLLNLLNNTRQHIAHNAQVTIEIKDNTIYYRDNGKKMIEADFYKLLQPFVTGKPNNSSGYGVGLAFCDQVIKILGGSLTFAEDVKNEFMITEKEQVDKIGCGEFRIYMPPMCNIIKNT